MNGEKRRFISVEYQSPSVSISSLFFSPSRNCICIDVGAFGPYSQVSEAPSVAWREIPW
jgi:hypothetical protein